MSNENIFAECATCIATPFCPAYAGKVTLTHTDWCRGNYRLNEALKLSEIPQKYREANIFNFKQDGENAAAFKTLQDKTGDIVDLVNRGKNFFIFGNKPGTGKTYAAAALLNHFLYKTCMTQLFDFEHPLSLYVDYSDLIDQLRYGRDYGVIDDGPVEKIRDVPFLLLDDIGSSTMTEFVREQTFRIVNYRLNKGLSTIVTSNYTIKQLSTDDKLGPRIVSRLMDGTIGIEMTGRDRRIQK